MEARRHAASHQMAKPLPRLDYLPKPLLIQLMHTVDPVSVECLRRCSLVFLKLFSEAYPQDVSSRWKVFFPYPVSLLRLDEKQKAQLLFLTKCDAYCISCLTVPTQSDYQDRLDTWAKTFMHCSGCQMDHPRYLFSAEQRRTPSRIRICIGHEGYVRLCDHKTVTWAQIMAVLKQPEPLRQLFRLRRDYFSNRFSTFAICQHWSHGLSCGLISAISNSRLEEPHEALDYYPFPTLAGQVELRNHRFTLALVRGRHFARRVQDASMPISFLEDQQRHDYMSQLGSSGCPRIEPGRLSGTPTLFAR